MAQAQQGEEEAGEVPPVSAAQKRLCTLATCVIDLPCGGRRLVAQSVIPGILSGDQLSKLVLGAILHNVPLVQDETMKSVLEEASTFFHIASREMPSIPLKELPSSQPEEIMKNRHDLQSCIEKEKANTMVLHGAVEMKGIIGSDGRKYILDCLRITPRDANFLPTKLGGTGKWEEVDSSSGVKKAELKDSHVNVLRPELVQRWKRRQEELKNDKKVTLAIGEVNHMD